MNNFINFRIKGVNNIKLKGSLEHNFRSKNSRNDKNDNDNIFYPINQVQGIELPNGSDKGLNKAIAGNFYDEYLEDRKEHNTFYKNRRKQNLKDMQGSWFEGVVTFSEQLKYDLGDKYTNDELKMATKAALDEIMEYMGSELKYVVLHLNETTPHFHFHAKNYDKDGRSLTHKFNSTKDLSLFQDIMYKHLKSLGLERGIKKQIGSKSNHQRTERYYELEFDKVARYIREHYTILNNMKNEIKKQRDMYDRQSKEFKQLDISYKKFVKLEKEARLDFKEANNLKEQAIEWIDDFKNNEIALESEYRDKLNEVQKNCTNIFGKLNINKFKEAIVELNEFNYAKEAKFITQEQEIKKLRQKVQKLENLKINELEIGSKLESQEQIIKNQSLEIKSKNLKIKEQDLEIKNLEHKNLELENKIRELEPEQEQKRTFTRHR